MKSFLIKCWILNLILGAVILTLGLLPKSGKCFDGGKQLFAETMSISNQVLWQAK